MYDVWYMQKHGLCTYCIIKLHCKHNVGSFHMEIWRVCDIKVNVSKQVPLEDLLYNVFAWKFWEMKIAVTIFFGWSIFFLAKYGV